MWLTGSRNIYSGQFGSTRWGAVGHEKWKGRKFDFSPTSICANILSHIFYPSIKIWITKRTMNLIAASCRQGRHRQHYTKATLLSSIMYLLLNKASCTSTHHLAATSARGRELDHHTQVKGSSTWRITENFWHPIICVTVEDELQELREKVGEDRIVNNYIKFHYVEEFCAASDIWFVGKNECKLVWEQTRVIFMLKVSLYKFTERSRKC